MTPAPITTSVSGTLSSVERAGRGDDLLLVDFDALEPGHVGAGGDDDVLRLDDVLAVDLRPCRPQDLGRAADRRDLVLLEQEIDALGVAVDRFLLEHHHLREIERRRHADTHLGEGMLGLGEELGGMQQRLGGNAADIETGAAMSGALLDHRHLHAELGRADGADIARRVRCR